MIAPYPKFKQNQTDPFLFLKCNLKSVHTATSSKDSAYFYFYDNLDLGYAQVLFVSTSFGQAKASIKLDQAYFLKCEQAFSGIINIMKK